MKSLLEIIYVYTWCTIRVYIFILAALSVRSQSVRWVFVVLGRERKKKIIIKTNLISDPSLTVWRWARRRGNDAAVENTTETAFAFGFCRNKRQQLWRLFHVGIPLSASGKLNYFLHRRLVVYTIPWRTGHPLTIIISLLFLFFSFRGNCKSPRVPWYTLFLCSCWEWETRSSELVVLLSSFCVWYFSLVCINRHQFNRCSLFLCRLRLTATFPLRLY